MIFDEKQRQGTMEEGVSRVKTKPGEVEGHFFSEVASDIVERLTE